jgi:putative flippase GtrA
MRPLRTSSIVKIATQLVGYFFTGGTAAIVDVAGFILLIDQGLSVVPAAICSFAVAAVVNYLLSSRFVFKSEASTRQFLLFAVAALVGLAVNVGVTYLKVTMFDLAPALAKVVGIGTAFLVNFTINRTLVFGK